jgi:hypothetical protein
MSEEMVMSKDDVLNHVANEVAGEVAHEGVYALDPALIAVLIQLIPLIVNMFKNAKCLNKQTLQVESSKMRPIFKAQMVRRAKQVCKEHNLNTEENKPKALVNRLLHKGATLSDAQVTALTS